METFGNHLRHKGSNPDAVACPSSVCLLDVLTVFIIRGLSFMLSLVLLLSFILELVSAAFTQGGR